MTTNNISLFSCRRIHGDILNKILFEGNTFIPQRIACNKNNYITVTHGIKSEVANDLRNFFYPQKITFPVKLPIVHH